MIFIAYNGLLKHYTIQYKLDEIWNVMEIVEIFYIQSLKPKINK